VDSITSTKEDFRQDLFMLDQIVSSSLLEEKPNNIGKYIPQLIPV